jgi:hypothetical protein
MSCSVVDNDELVYDHCMSSFDTSSTVQGSGSDADPDAAVAGAAGALNLAHAELTRVAADAVRHDSWSGTSPVQWLTYRAGITTSRANTILAVAAKRDRFPTIIARFDAAELSLEQVHELVQAPPCADADIEHWGTIATPARIRTSIKRRYGTTNDDNTSDDVVDVDEQPTPVDERVERDWVATGITDDHRFRIRGEYDLDTGQLINAALLQAREQLWTAGQRRICDADCLREIIERFLDRIDTPLQRDRSKIWIHLDATTGDALTSTGVRVPDSVRDKICCDGIIQPVWEHDGIPFNLGRTQHLVPERTRRIIMLRDQGCRVPGCTHDRIIEIHHIIHWNQDGPTSSWNLVALCPKHHRMHHQHSLGITGNADQPDGLVFTDHRGRQLQPCGAPTPPTPKTPPPHRKTPPPPGHLER